MTNPQGAIPLAHFDLVAVAERRPQGRALVSGSGSSARVGLLYSRGMAWFVLMASASTTVFFSLLVWTSSGFLRSTRSLTAQLWQAEWNGYRYALLRFLVLVLLSWASAALVDQGR